VATSAERRTVVEEILKSDIPILVFDEGIDLGEIRKFDNINSALSEFEACDVVQESYIAIDRYGRKIEFYVESGGRINYQISKMTLNDQKVYLDKLKKYFHKFFRRKAMGNSLLELVDYSFQVL